MSGDPCIASTPPLDSYQSLGMLPDPPPASVYPAPAATPLSRAIPAHRASLLSSTSAADRAYQLSTQTPQALHAYPADDLASSTLSALRAWQLAQLTQTPSAHHANPATDMQSSQPLSSDQDRSRMSAASTSMSSLPPVNIDSAPSLQPRRSPPAKQRSIAGPSFPKARSASPFSRRSGTSPNDRLDPVSRLRMSPTPTRQVMADLSVGPRAVDALVAEDEDDGTENERGSRSKRERRHSTEAKGKGRAVDSDKFVEVNLFLASDKTDGRVQRARKKRRLSAADEVDPDDLDEDGSLNTKARREPSNLQNGHSKDVSLNAADRLYFARIYQNSQRLPLRDMKGLCPVWAKTRRALQSAADYLREPVKTIGASVHIGVGGIAQGIILEGQAGQGTFWGTGEQAGTIVTSIGAPRPIVKFEQRDMKANNTPNQCQALPCPDAGQPVKSFSRLTPPRNNLPSPVAENVSDTSPPSMVDGSRREKDSTARAPEASEIAALLIAQRARTPLAIAVAQDYSAAPFDVPRRFVVLGWFWIVDAWVEPDLLEPPPSVCTTAPPKAIDNVSWKFRFEWCSVGQSTPWWSHRNEPDRIVPSPDSDGVSKSWIIAGPEKSGSTTVQRKVPLNKLKFQLPQPATSSHEYFCPICFCTSERVYAKGDICLNEVCPRFFRDVSRIEHRLGPPVHWPSEPRALTRIDPTSAGLRIRPPEPNDRTVNLARDQVGAEFWRGWVCNTCGMANEREKWSQWECEACGRVICTQRRIYDDEQLRPLSRPICTGPRQEAGYPNWPFPVTRSWTLFSDDIKVMKHGVEAAFGVGAEVFHALNSEGKTAHVTAQVVLRGFQLQGSSEVPFRRHAPPSSDLRPAEEHLSPFYTYSCGGGRTSELEPFPSAKAVEWTKVPRSCLDAADLINERAARMFPGQRERFNALLITAFPPQLPTSLQPRITIPSETYLAFLYLGSDGSMRFRRKSYAPGVRMKQGEITIQHGDVVGVKSGPDDIEILPKLDGFGFLCIARQAYHHATEDPTNSIRDGSADYQSPTPLTNARDKASKPRGSAGARFSSKPVRPSLPPLTNWYIGPWPLDSQQPIRVRMAQPRKGRRHHPESIANHSNLPLQQEPNGLETELSHTGMKILPSTPPPASLHAPPLSLDQEMNPPKDVDSLFKPKKPSAGHAKEKYPQGPSSISSIIDVESNGTPFKTEMIGLDDADEVMNIVSKGRRRGGGVGRSRGGARGRGVKKGAIEAL